MLVKKFELFVNHANTSGVVQVNQEDASGRPIDPISLTVSEDFVMAFADLFSEAQQAAVTTLTTAKITLATELALAVTAKQTLETQVATLTSEKQVLSNEKSALQSQVNTISGLQSRLQQLELLVPWNTRWIAPGKFIARFTAQQARLFYNSVDPMLVGGKQLLDAYEAANYQVVLDDDQVTGLLTYMVVLGIVNDMEKANLLRDSVYDERYIPTP